VFYGEKGKRMELVGDNGEIFNDTNDITVSGNVKITTSDGYLFRADSLRYSSEKKVVTTESKVFIKGKGLEIEGIGMSADIERNTALIKSGVKAVLEGNVK
ncbi:MAG: LPS export ABC transporter periplasmic protein LptC, partial [Deltaproteobacteria bacterium]